MKEFDTYIKVIESYGGKTPIHPGIIKAKLAKMVILYTDNTTPNEKYQSEEEVEEEYL